MTNELRSAVEEYFNSWVAGDEAGMRALIHDEARFPNNPPGFAQDKEGAIELAMMHKAAFPDLTATMERWVTEGDQVVIRFKVSGTHKGEFMGIAPTNKHATVGGISMLTFRDGKIAEEVTEFDSLGLLTQLGVIPELSPAQG